MGGKSTGVCDRQRWKDGKRMRSIEQARREYKERNKWGLFCRGHPLEVGRGFLGIGVTHR